MSGSRNLLPLYRQLIGSLLVSGSLLALLLPIGLFSLTSLPFRFVWGAHIFAHLVVLLLVFRLWFELCRQTGRASSLYLAGAVLALATSAAVGALPIISRDALIYHLAVPKWWLVADRVIEIPWHEWSHFPLLLSGAYAGFLELGLGRLTPLYHLSYLVILSGMILSFVFYKFQDSELALLTGAVALVMPLSIKLGSEPMADLAVAVFFGASLALFTVWTELRGKAKYLSAVGVALGLALSTKYNALLAAVVTAPCAILFLKRWRYPLPVAVRTLGVIGLIAFAVYLPWPAKNAIHTGNPFYPFLASVFGGADELPFLGEVGPIRYRLEGYGEGVLDLLLIPFRMMVFGRDDSPQQFDGLLSPILLFAALSVLMRSSDDKLAPWVRLYGGVCALYFVASLFLFYALVRYQMPMFLPLLALTAAGISAVGDLRGGIYQTRLYRTLFVLQLLWCGWYGVGLLARTGASSYLASNSQPSDYLHSHLSEFRVAEAVNEKLPPQAVVYLLFTGNRYFYYDRAVRGAYFSAAPIVASLKRDPSPASLLAEFKQMGVTHLAVHNRRTLEALKGLAPSEKAAWSQFVQLHLQLISEDRGVGLYVLNG